MVKVEPGASRKGLATSSATAPWIKRVCQSLIERAYATIPHGGLEVSVR